MVMALEREENVTPEAESSEKPVREQLQKATISKIAGEPAPHDNDAAAAGESPSESSDSADGHHGKEVQHEQSLKAGIENGAPIGEVATTHPDPLSSTRHHTRKRSRDSTAEEEELNNGQRKSLDRPQESKEGEAEQTNALNGHPPPKDRSHTPEQAAERATAEQVTSPKSKRSRLESATGEEKGVTDEAVSQVRETSTQPKADSTAKLPPSSGFANTASTSPFASLSSPKAASEEDKASASAFAASGFSALTGSTSGFGAIGKTTGGFGVGGGFATGVKGAKPVGDTAGSFGKQGGLSSTSSSDTPSGSVFGGALGGQAAFTAASGEISSFGSNGSAFGKVGSTSGFGGGLGGSGFGGLGGGGGLTTFASGKPSSSLSSAVKPSKPFGAPAAEEEEDAQEEEVDPDDSGIRSPLSTESDKQDTRFYEQDLETGEEDEQTEYSCRGKLYSFNKEWKERGLGVVRLNVSKPSGGEEDPAQPKARLLMRAEGSHRVILNTPVKKELRFGDANGGSPQGGQLIFRGVVDGSTTLVPLLLKARQQFITELYEKIAELQAVM